MTKIAIVSDIHLKLRKFKDFERGRFRRLFKHLSESTADTIIINGDLLDYAVPTLEEIKEISDAFTMLQDKTVYLLSGNHEGVSREKSTYDYLSFRNVKRPKDGISTISLDGVKIRLCDWTMIHSIKDSGAADILVTHYRSALPGLYSEEVTTSDFIDKFKLVILGDIHSRYSPAPNVFYTGSPYSISSTRKVSEQFGYIELSLSNYDYTWKYVDLKLPQKVRVDMEYKRLKEFIPNSEHLYTVHVTGTIEELKSITGYDNVTFVKNVTLQEPVKTSTTIEDKTFMDSLTEKVEEQLGEKNRHKAKEVLINIQGEC